MARKAGTSRRFGQGVRQWAKDCEENAEATIKRAAIDFRDHMLELTPIDTGNLRSSLVLGLNGNIPQGPHNAYMSDDNEARARAVVASMKAGDTIDYRYLAPYAMRVELGFVGTDSLGRRFNQSGQFFIRRAGTGWNKILRRAATELWDKTRG